MKYTLACTVSFLLTALITPLIIRLATACRCFDVPGRRRLHTQVTPRWGGLGFFAGVLPVLFLVNPDGFLTSYIIASVLLVGVGTIDDLKELGWKAKLSATGAAATIVIFGSNSVIRSLGVYGPDNTIELGLLSIPFTYLAIIGVTNAINLLDGLNGLAGGVSLLGFLFMGTAAVLAGNSIIALICFAFVGALAGFLIYNFPSARIFMGDSGSIFLGFSLSLMAVLLTQQESSSVDPLFPVLVLLLPIFDTLRVLFVRLLNGKHPFQADILHLHYLMVQRISSVNAVLLMWAFTALAGIVALLLLDNTSQSFLAAALYGCLVLIVLTETAMRSRKKQAPIESEVKSRPFSNPRNTFFS